MSLKKEHESNFIERTFGDESRNPFPGKPKKSFNEVKQKFLITITDDILKDYINNPKKLSQARLEYISACLQRDQNLLNRFITLKKGTRK